LYVIDRYTLNQVSIWRGKISPEDFAKVALVLGFFYNTATLAIEINNHGQIVVSDLRRMNYPQLYRRKIIDNLGHIETLHIGWETTLKSKPFMVDRLGVVLRSRAHFIRDEITLRELLTFEDKGSNGKYTKYEAAHGCFDDCVIAGAIAVTAHFEMPPVREVKPVVHKTSAEYNDENIRARKRIGRSRVLRQKVVMLDDDGVERVHELVLNVV